MRAFFLLAICLLCLSACEQSSYQPLDHNFTLQRLIILNDQQEMLMSREDSVWAMPFLLYQDRQHVKEGLDSVANSYGLTITEVELRGQFSYHYDYHPYASLRNYYFARYVSGTLKITEPVAEAKWLPIPEAIERNSITSIKEITRQIMNYPDVVWGGSFMVREEGDEHPTEMVEEFYVLFKRE
ncbi:MAG: hypothetical protein AAGF89_13110 [Bacteroidota bacterium]